MGEVDRLIYVNKKYWPVWKGKYMTKEQLGQLILSSEQQLYATARTILNQDQDCADAIQEAIVKAFSKYGSLKEDRFAKSWLIRILINECYNILRREQKRVSIEEVPMEPVVHTEEKDYSELYRAVRDLKEELNSCDPVLYGRISGEGDRADPGYFGGSRSETLGESQRYPETNH